MSCALPQHEAPARATSTRRNGDWDEQYRRGRWDHLADRAEAPRYAALAGLIRAAGGTPSVLDLGCGAGLLARELPAGVRRRYTGVDISSEAIAAAERAAPPAGAAFVTADVCRWEPAGPVDVIVFNEVLYYLRDAEAVARRYAGRLTPGGLLVVSMYAPDPLRRPVWRRRVSSIWRGLHRHFEVARRLDVNGDGVARTWRIESYRTGAG